MDRRKFLMGLGVLPFVSTSLFANKSENIKKEYVLVGLGDSGHSIVNGLQDLGFNGKVYTIEVAKADNLHIRLTERLLHGEEIAAKPNFLFSTFTKQKNIVPVFVSGLGGVRSTYLAALAHHEMVKSGKPFHMFLTTPFEFEGPLRNTRAKKFQLATGGDMSIKYINLNDCPRDIWSTVEQGFTKFPAEKIYPIFSKLGS
ncbi:MAG: hypothetical protein ACO3AY_08575 [Chitinophagaceae bacterium]